MAHNVFALFHDSQNAGESIKRLMNLDVTKEISILAKDYKETDAEFKKVKNDNVGDISKGAAIGAAAGGIAALVAGLTSITLPLGVIIAGPLAAALSSAAGGAVVGGISALLIDRGVSEAQARNFEERVLAGDVLIQASIDHDKEENAEEIFKDFGADQIITVHQ